MKNTISSRLSWDTSVKHYIRKGLTENLPAELRTQIPTSNYYRWANESDDKYVGCEVAQYINQEIELVKRVGQNSKVKRVLEGYFKMSDVLFSSLEKIKGVKKAIAENKDVIVNTIENLKESVPVEKAIKVFNISRSTYQHYKKVVLNKCDNSYFLWCTKRYSHQLLKSEVLQIKKYMEMDRYKYWSKSSIYLKAIREKAICCGLSTWYKYCKLLGFTKRRYIRAKDK